jgi:hypothetical protein
MITKLNPSDVDSETYLGLYIALKNAIGRYEVGDEDKKVPGIYCIYNEAGTLLYVGKSKNLASRLTTHIRGKYRYSYKITIEYVEQEELDDVERFLIDTLEPIDNVRVNEHYDIENTTWAELFLDLDESYTEFYNFTNLSEYMSDDVNRTVIYPDYLLIKSKNLIPHLCEYINEIAPPGSPVFEGIKRCLLERL